MNIAFIIILKFILKFSNLAIRFDFINNVIINKFIITSESVLRFLNLAIKFDFIDDIIVNKIEEIIFIKKRS